MQPSILAKRGSVLIFAIVISFYLYGLGHLPLVGPDEPRYAQVAREMLLRGDLITPTLGGHNWFEKPALLYWMMIASFKLFGVSEWSARLGPALSGLLTVAAVWWVGTRTETNNRDQALAGFGFWSALILATSLGMIVFARAASFDVVVTMTTTWALSFFVVSEIEGDAKRRRRLLAGFYLAVGLSLLAKGLVGLVVPWGVVAVYYLAKVRAPDRIVRNSLLWGLPITIATAATWYGPMIWRHGSPFVSQFFIQHHFARYFSDRYHHPGPIYYYLGVILLFTLPWTAFMVGGLLPIRQWLRRSGNALSNVSIFALVWILLPLVFFSFSSSKLPGYILPALPGAALLAGGLVVRLNFGAERRLWPHRVTAAVCFVLSLAAFVYAKRTGEFTVVTALAMTAPLMIAGVFAMVSKASQLPLLIVAAATLFFVVTALHVAAPRFAARDTSKELLRLAEARGYSQTSIYGLQPDDRTPEFYAAGRVVYSANGEALIYEGAPYIVNESHRRKGPLLAFATFVEANELMQAHAATVEVIGDNGRYVLVAVRPR